jgi:hypothetical protein
MKRISTLVFLSFILPLSIVMGQTSRTIDFSNSKSRNFSMLPSPDVQFRAEMDTLFAPALELECGNTLFDYTLTEQWGTVSGMNGYTDLQKAQRFSYEGATTYSVNEVGVFFSIGEVVEDGEITVNIYSVSSGGGPGSLLGTSDPLNVSDLVIPGEEDPLLPTLFSFSTPSLVSGDQFFVSVDFTALYETRDTVAIFNTEDGCGDGTTTWELFGDNTTWNNYLSSWELNADLAVFAVVEEQEDIVLQPVDTAFTPSFFDTCGQTVTFFGVTDGWGYVAGTNNFGDLEKAQRFDFQGASDYNLTEVGVFFHDAIVVGDGNVVVKIYDVANNGAPGQVLGTSNPLAVSQLITDDIVPTGFSFSEPVPLNDNRFFVSVDLSALYASQDTVGIWHTRPNCGDGDDTWELFDDGTTWVPFTSESSWQLDAELLIYAVLEQMSTDVDELTPEQAGLYLKEAYPNPASHQITLDYSLDQKEDINIGIHRANGQLVRNHNLGSRAQGAHREVLPLNDLSSGVYFYSFSTSKTRVLKKFIVQK